MVMIALDKSPSCQMEEEYIYFCQNTLVIRSILDQAGNYSPDLKID